MHQPLERLGRVPGEEPGDPRVERQQSYLQLVGPDVQRQIALLERPEARRWQRVQRHPCP